MPEVVQFHIVADDAATGVAARLIVDGSTSSLWVVVASADAVWSAVCEGLPAVPPRGIDTPLAIYEQTGPASITFTRHGMAGSVEGLNVIAAVLANRVPAPTAGPRRGVLGVDASITGVVVTRPSGAVGSGRAEVRLPDGDLVVEGSGAVQELVAPTAFDLTLHGQHLKAGATDGTGWVFRGGSSIESTAVALDPPGDDRAVSFTLSDLSTVEGRLASVHTWSGTIDGRETTGSFVKGVVGDVAVSGWVTNVA